MLSVSLVAYSGEACGTLDERSCFMQAVTPLKQSSITKDELKISFNKLAELCVSSNNAKSCDIAADIAHDMLKDSNLALELYAQKCDEGLPQYCGAAVLLTKDPKSNLYNIALAQKYSVKGCAAKDAYLCYQQGSLHSPFTEGSLLNGALAQEGYYLACRYGKGVKHISERRRSQGCFSAYFMGEGGTGDFDLNPNPDYRLFGLKTACVIDNKYCERAVSSLYHGLWGIERQIEEAGLLAEHLCVQGDYTYCGQASAMWRESGQYGRAIRFSALLCEKYPSGDNCTMNFLTAYSIYGDEAPETVHAANDACDNKSGIACAYLGALGEGYQHGSTDDVYTKACNYGIQNMCDYIKEVNSYHARKKRREQARNDAQAREQQIKHSSYTPDFASAARAYWSNWKPSYCSNYTKGGITNKVECAN